MDIQQTKKELLELLLQSIMLAKQARREQREKGCVTVVCPKCGMSLEIMTTSRGERTIVSCKCGYVYEGVINF